MSIFSSVNIGQQSSPGNILPVAPRHLPTLSPRNVEQFVSPSSRQLSSSTIIMPTLSPHIKQVLSPEAVQSLSTRTRVVSPLSSRQLFPDQSEQFLRTNEQLPFNNGQIVLPNYINQFADFRDQQGFRQENPAHLAEVTRNHQLSHVNQAYQVLQVTTNDQHLIQGTRLPPTQNSPQNVWSPVISPGHEQINSAGIICQSKVLRTTFSSREKTHGQQTEFIHSTEFNPYSSPNILPNKQFQNSCVMLEPTQKNNYGQKGDGLPDLKTMNQGLPNTGQVRKDGIVMCTNSSTCTSRDTNNTVSDSEDVIVTKVTGISNRNGTKQDQINTINIPKYGKDHDSAQLQYQVSSYPAHSRSLGQQIQSKSLEQGLMAGSRQQKLGLQEHKDNSDVPQVPSPALLQTMMANHSPSKLVVMKMCGSDKYIILSPEKSSALDMVYKPMGSMKLPPGKYRIHTMNGNAVSVGSDKVQTPQQNPDCSSVCEVSNKEPSDTGKKISKEKSSTKVSKKKEKKECKKEKKRKEPSTKEAGTKKAKNKVEKKKINPDDDKSTAKVKKSSSKVKQSTGKDKKPTSTDRKSASKDKKSASKDKNPPNKDKKSASKAKNKFEKKKNPVDEKTTAQGKKSTEQDKMSKSKNAKDPKNPSSKEKKIKSQPSEKKIQEKKEETQCRILTPCQKFCKTVLITHNQTGKIVHTISNPAIFFTGGQFSTPQDTTDVDHPVFLLFSDHKILAIMSEAFSPGQYLLSSKQRIIFKDEFISSNLHNKDTRKDQLILYRAVLSPYYFSVSSPMKGHEILLLSHYQDVATDTSSTEGTSELLESPDLQASLLSDVVNTWDLTYDTTTLPPCTHPLYETMQEMLKNKIDSQPKTRKYKLRVQLFDSRRKKRPKIGDLNSEDISPCAAKQLTDSYL